MGCDCRQIVGQTHHILVSEWGRRWCDIELVMFTLYIDDSGTDPRQHVAVATALIIPAKQIVRLENEWEAFRHKENFECFHTSEFVFKNHKSEFANWDDQKQEQVFKRVRQICKKYGSRALSIAVNKKDYDEVVPPDFRKYLGNTHYGWAVRQLLANLSTLCPVKSDSRREFIFQWLERHVPARIEIEDMMDQMQFISEKEGVPGDYSDPHFRKSAGIPGLQCVDAVAWVSYQYALHVFKIYPEKPLAKFVAESWKEFEGHLGTEGWLKAATLRRESLERSIKKAIPDGKAAQFFKEWNEYKMRIRQLRSNDARTGKSSSQRDQSQARRRKEGQKAEA